MWRSGEKHSRQKVCETRMLRQECACMECGGAGGRWGRGQQGIDEVRELTGDKQLGLGSTMHAFLKGKAWSWQASGEF